MSRLFHRTNLAAMTLLLSMVMTTLAGPAFAQQAQGKTLGDLTNNLYGSLLSLQTFLSLLSYILGIFFSITGLQMLKDYVDDPGRNPAKGPVLRLAAAAFFIFAPTFASLLINSISGNGANANLLTFSGGTYKAAGATDTGLESALVRFVDTMAAPLLENLLPFIAYAAGLIFMLIGLKRLALANGDGPQAPGGLGTMGTFFVAAALMAFGYIMGSIEGSIFGDTNITNNPSFTGAAQGDLTESANHAMWGVFIFLRIVGYISVLRALFMLRAAGEGGQVSVMQISTHMIAGALLANATGFVLAVQSTFVDPSNWILQK